MAEIKTYRIWNTNISHTIGVEDDSTYSELLAAEEKHNTSVSSLVRTDDIAQLIQSIYNETYVHISHHEET